MRNEQKAETRIRFVEATKLTKDFHGHAFNLLDWQKEFISDVYGTVDEDGFRQYKYAYLEVPKKNGKTEMIASLGLSHLFLDAHGGEIYCCAAEKTQAGLVYDAICSKIDQSPALKKFLKITDSRKTIKNIKTGTFLRVMSSEAYSKHGLNPSVIIFDELHALQKPDMYEVMTFGSGAARKEQLVLIITTAGDDPDQKSIGWQKHEYARKVQAGEIIDPYWYVKIYCAPEDADMYDESVWYQANPSLGTTIDIKNVRIEALQARNDEAAEKLFRWLRLNQWVSLKAVGWLPLSAWDKSHGKWKRDDLAKRRCYVGLDLSSTTDLTAATVLFPPDRKVREWRFFNRAWIPLDNIRRREDRDHVPFSDWIKKGYVVGTPGNCVDYEYVAKFLMEIEETYNLVYVCGDAWRLECMSTLLNETITQRKVIQISQTIAGMSPAILESERMFLDGEITHEKNDCARWCFGNVAVHIDGNENKKFMKNRSVDRIDVSVSLINALAGAMKNEPQRSPYENRGIRVV